MRIYILNSTNAEGDFTQYFLHSEKRTALEIAKEQHKRGERPYLYSAAHKEGVKVWFDWRTVPAVKQARQRRQAA